MSTQAQQGNIPINPHEVWNAWQVGSLQELWAAMEIMHQVNKDIPILEDDVRMTPNFAPVDSQAKELPLAERP